MAFETFLATLSQFSNVTTMAALFALIGVASLIEVVVPLHARDRSRRPHALPNLVLTALTFGMGLVLGSAILAGLVVLEASGFGALQALDLTPLWSVVIAVLALDFTTYVCHVALHKVPAWWRYHRVHHSDLAVDATTAFRQHPGETVIRYAFLAAAAFVLGVSPVAFGVYRMMSAVVAVPEHANIRAPAWVDDLLSLVVTWPTLHKAHHSRDARETDTNYGNIFSFWDRLFFTFTPAGQGRKVVYGLDGFDEARDHTVFGLLATPFRRREIDEGARDHRRA